MTEIQTITLKFDSIVPHFVGVFDQISECSLINALEVVGSVSEKHPDWSLMMSLLFAHKTFQHYSKIEYLASSWSEVANYLHQGNQSQHYALVKAALWTRFSRAAEELAGGVVGAAEIRCRKLKSRQAKENTWLKARSLFDKLISCGVYDELPEFIAICRNWQAISQREAIAYFPDDLRKLLNPEQCSR